MRERQKNNPRTEKIRAPRNRTITLNDAERNRYSSKLLRISNGLLTVEAILDKTIPADIFQVSPLLPSGFCDLVFADPPYNLTKDFHGNLFRKRAVGPYENWLRSWLPEMKRLLKPTGSIYICGDWRSSGAIQRVLEDHFVVRNRITWEREKGRGAKTNWKNASEDIWFATASDEYVFHVDRIMLKRKVIAPYTDSSGEAKDWHATESGRFRLTHPSNLWTDISVPFWSMPENTDHPTQKPEKLVAKIILAGTDAGDVVFDPFLGSGTTSVVAKKLQRNYVGVEINEDYCCLAEKRLALASESPLIQGYSDGVFWERNTLAMQKNSTKFSRKEKVENTLLDILD